MEITNRLFRRIASNWLGFAVQIAVTLALTPFILTRLGAEAYGIWALVSSVTGYYGLLDLGFRAGLTQYLARHLATADYRSLNVTASTGFLVLISCSIIVGGFSVALAHVAPIAFHVPPVLVSDARMAILVVGLGFAAQFACFPFSALLTAAHRFETANVIGVFTRLGGALATYIALRNGGGIVALSVITTATTSIDYGLRALAAYRAVPQLSITAKLFSWVECRRMLSFGLWNVSVEAGIRLILYSDAIVIGVFLAAAAITPFAVAVSLATYYSQLFVPIGQVFFPLITALDAKGLQVELRALYASSSRWLALLSLQAAILATICARPFLSLWVGPVVLEGNRYGSAATLFVILAIGAAATGSQRIGYQVLLGRRQVRVLAVLILLEALVNLVLSVLLVGSYGLCGVALGTALPALVFNLGVHPVVVCHTLGQPVGPFLRSVWSRPLLAGGITIILAYPLTRVLSWDTWQSLFASATIVAGLQLAVSAVGGASHDERHQLWGIIQKRMASLLGHGRRG